MTVDRRVTSEAIDGPGEVALGKPRSQDDSVRQGYARGFIAKVVVAPDVITIAGPLKPLEIAVSDGPDQRTPMAPSLDQKWCTAEDLGAGAASGARFRARRSDGAPRLDGVGALRRGADYPVASFEAAAPKIEAITGLA